MQKTGSKLLSCGAYLPQKIISNDDLCQSLETSDEWIVERTGIKQRHIAIDEDTAQMAAKAGMDAINNAGIDANKIGLIILATSTPDNCFPASATKVQELLKIDNAFAFDINAACSGFVYALSIADALIKSLNIDYALVIGSEKMSKIVNWQDRSTSILFGDGAGAFVLQKTDEKELQLSSFNLFSDGSFYNDLLVKKSNNQDLGYIEMNGREIFKQAVLKMSHSIQCVLKDNNLNVGDVDFFIPHQANKRIIDSICDKLNVESKKMIVSVDKHANTSAASIPLAFYNAYYNDKIIKNGNRIIVCALGAGVTWGSLMFKVCFKK